MTKPKRTAEQQIADETDRKAQNPVGARQTIADRHADPEFQENHRRLKAERLARDCQAQDRQVTALQHRTFPAVRPVRHHNQGERPRKAEARQITERLATERLAMTAVTSPGFPDPTGVATISSGGT
jgi:hypothetical protein